MDAGCRAAVVGQAAQVPRTQAVDENNDVDAQVALLIDDVAAQQRAAVEGGVASSSSRNVVGWGVEHRRGDEAVQLRGELDVGAPVRGSQRP